MLKKKKIAALFSVMMLALSSLSADTIKPNGCKGPTLCNSFPIYDGCGWHFDIGLIYEQMRISNTDIAHTLFYEGSGLDYDNPRYDVGMINQTFNIDPGLRVGLGKYFKHDDWMFNVKFEWLNSLSKTNLDLDGTSINIVPAAMFNFSPFNGGLSTSGEFATFKQLQARLTVDYFLLDAYISRGSYFSNNFTFEPLAGLKASWINYTNSVKFLNGQVNTVNPEMRLTNTYIDFWGVGPMVGMNGNYHICAGWSFFSTANFSVLLGESRLLHRYGLVINTDPTDLRVKSIITALCPTMRNIIGLQYDKDIYCDKQHYSLRFGFDSRYYFNQYPILDSTRQFNSEGAISYNVQDNGSFGMIGFLLDFGWDF